jgi:hypothetical protein
MPRLSKFFNAPIAMSRRFSPEIFIRKADKKFQKKRNWRAEEPRKGNIVEFALTTQFETICINLFPRSAW